MSRGINKVILIGNLGNEPEIRVTPSGTIIATLSVATSEQWKDRNTGQQQTKTEWHRVVIFGKLAEIAQQYLHKGSQVYLEGKLQTRKWQGQDGQDRYTTEVMVDSFNGQLQMLDNKRSDMEQNTYAPSPVATNSFNQTSNHHTRKSTNGFDEYDDIPFDDVPF